MRHSWISTNRKAKLRKIINKHIILIEIKLKILCA